jgi:hypothetical protein
LESLRLAADPSAEHAAILDQVKQIGFYTDCMGDAHWSEPDKVVDEGLARTLVDIADLFAKNKTITVKEVELWVEHMRPSYGASLECMKAALLNWYAAMREHGLWEEGDIKVETFVLGEQAAGAGRG